MASGHRDTNKWWVKRSTHSHSTLLLFFVFQKWKLEKRMKTWVGHVQVQEVVAAAREGGCWTRRTRRLTHRQRWERNWQERLEQTSRLLKKCFSSFIFCVSLRDLLPLFSLDFTLCSWRSLLLHFLFSNKTFFLFQQTSLVTLSSSGCTNFMKRYISPLSLPSLNGQEKRN